MVKAITVAVEVILVVVVVVVVLVVAGRRRMVCFSGRLLIPAAGWYGRLITWTDPLGQFYMPPLCDGSWKSNLESKPWLITFCFRIPANCIGDKTLHWCGPLERACWRQFAALWGDCKKSQIAPLNAIIINIIIIIIIIIIGVVVKAFISSMVGPRFKFQPNHLWLEHCYFVTILFNAWGQWLGLLAQFFFCGQSVVLRPLVHVSSNWTVRSRSSALLHSLLVVVSSCSHN